MVSLFTNSLLLTGGGLDFRLKIVLRYGGLGALVRLGRRSRKSAAYHRTLHFKRPPLGQAQVCHTLPGAVESARFLLLLWVRSVFCAHIPGKAMGEWMDQDENARSPEQGQTICKLTWSSKDGMY